MRFLPLLLAGCLMVVSSSYACVTVNPGTGTYTIDKSGCVDHGGGKTHKPAKSPSKDKAPQKK